MRQCVLPCRLFTKLLNTHGDTHALLMQDKHQRPPVQTKKKKKRLASLNDFCTEPLHKMKLMRHCYFLPKKKKSADKSGICGAETTQNAEPVSPVAVIYSRLS